MSKIIELPEVLANQIAAGEVVERPASVVKELVENAIDAGSTRIHITIVESGLKLIEVVDNGMGIESDDVPKAILRHATSKIKTREDLFRIRTLGFRGEALPSIASVSELTMETCASDEPVGTRLIAKAGTVEQIESMAKIDGTKVCVENLFYNTPARLKYVKSLQAELSHIIDIINRESLAHPEISFSLISDGHELLTTAGVGDLQRVIAQIYGVATARKLLVISAEDLDFTLTGYISLPELTRANRNYITILLNGRYIKNFLLNRAIIEGYGSKLMVGRFPLVVLDIHIDPQLEDVNVHPTKQEVRLSKERELMALITQAIRDALSEEQLIPKALDNLPQHSQAPVEESVQTEFMLQEPSADYEIISEKVVVTDDINERKAKKEQTELSILTENNPVDKIEKKAMFPDLEFLSQFHRTYLLCQAPDGLYIVDQHAAQERVKYEYWRDKIGEVSYEQQTLLIPIILDLPKNDALTVSEKKEKLQEAGIYLQEYGSNTFILREHPIWMRENEIESSTYALIDLLLAEKDVSVKKYREDLAIMISCKSSIKANMSIDSDSARDLLKQLAHCENPYNCPHGRPAVIRFMNTDIEKMFRRIQASHDNAWISSLGE